MTGLDAAAEAMAEQWAADQGTLPELPELDLARWVLAELDNCGVLRWSTCPMCVDTGLSWRCGHGQEAPLPLWAERGEAHAVDLAARRTRREATS